MDIILLMTTEAGRLEVLLIENAFVTSSALRLYVFATQRKSCITIVIEDNAFPIPRRVTVIAFGAETPLMAFLVIVTPMARVTGGFQFFFIEEPLMTGHAFGEAVFAAQGEVSALIVVKK